MANTKTTNKNNNGAKPEAPVAAAVKQTSPVQQPLAQPAGKHAQAPAANAGKQGKDQAPKEAPNTKANNAANASPKAQPKNVGPAAKQEQPQAKKQEPVKQEQPQAKKQEQPQAKKAEQPQAKKAEQPQAKKQEQPQAKKAEQPPKQEPAKKAEQQLVKKEPAAPKTDENPLQPTVTASRQALQKFWSANAEAAPAAATPAAAKPNGKDAQKGKAAAPVPAASAKQSLKALSAQKWDSWSEAVRADFLKRCQTAVVASIQTKIPRKQWAQWEITLKFCLDDIFQRARGSVKNTFTEKEGLLALLQVIIDGHENDAEHNRNFQQKIDEMLQQMRDKPTITAKVQGFNIDDLSHVGTLRAIRSLYAIEYAHYVIGKLIASSS